MFYPTYNSYVRRLIIVCTNIFLQNVLIKMNVHFMLTYFYLNFMSNPLSDHAQQWPALSDVTNALVSKFRIIRMSEVVSSSNLNHYY